MKEIEHLMKELMLYINEDDGLMSLLYDMDLLPEQLEKGSRDWRRMLILSERWREKSSK